MRNSQKNGTTSSFVEAQGVPGSISVSGLRQEAREFASSGIHPISIQGELSITSYDRQQDYLRLKQEVRFPSIIERPEADPLRTALQADSQSLKTSEIFSTPRLPSDFAGLPYANQLPASCSIATGPSHLAMTSNTAWAVFDKAGQQLLCVDLAAWFASVTTEVIIFNSQIIYDQFAGRWLIVACGRSFAQKSSCFLLSVSQTRNPLGAWCNQVIDVTAPNRFPDGVSVGLDNAALYLSTNIVDENGCFQHTKLRVLNKAELLSGAPLRWLDYDDLRNADDSKVFGLQPAYTFGTPGTEYLINASSEGNTLTLWRLTQPFSAQPSLSRRTIPVAGYRTPPNAHQRGTDVLVETGDARLVNAVFRNGSLWTAHSIAACDEGESTVSAIQWFQINTGAGTISQQGIYGHSQFHYFCPTVMPDGQGNLMMIFNRVSERTWPELRFTGRLSTDTPGTLHSSVLLKEGTAPGRFSRTSFNGAAVDTNDTKIWLVGQYPMTEAECGTWIGETSYIAGNAESGWAVRQSALAR